MRSRSVLLVAATFVSLMSVGGCSSDSSTASSASTASTAPSTGADATSATAGTTDGADDGATPTVCATDAAGDQPTVTIDVDDESDGFGRFGLKTTSPLPAGPVRLAVDAVEDNADPVDVTVSTSGTSVFEFVHVAPGVLCGADVELA